MMRPRRESGFTLIELLVSMGIMITLGMTLMLILRGGLATWTTGEARRESSQVAQVVFSALREDLQSATIYRQRLGKSGPVEARFLADYDVVSWAAGDQNKRVVRQRLFLTRTIKAESENPVTGVAGTALNAAGVVDFHGDRAEALQQDLRATGGLMEVGYVLGAAEPRMLYRMVRSPVGGPYSLFNFDRLPPQRVDPKRQAVVEKFTAKLTAVDGIAKVRRAGAQIVLHLDGKYPPEVVLQSLRKEAWFKDFEAAMDTEEMDLSAVEGASDEFVRHAIFDTKLNTWGKPLASNVLFIGFEYWHEYTRSWKDELSETKPFRGLREHGPIGYWDSTRGILRPQVPRGHFSLFKGAASAANPEDDVLPARVRITLVIGEPPKAGSETELLTTLGEDTESFRVANPGRAPDAPGYVLVGHEWIRYREKNGNQLVVDENGRGARGTTAAKHESGVAAIFGRQFQTVIEIPSYAEDWSD